MFEKNKRLFSLAVLLHSALISLLGPSAMAAALSGKTAKAPKSSSANAQSKGAHGRQPASTKTFKAEELFARYKSAVVKVVIKQYGIPVTVGSGFFISRDGQLITNRHILSGAIATPGFTTEFILSNGTVVRNYELAGCGDARNIDLCLLKLKTPSPSYFDVSTSVAQPGQTVYAIGHPRNLDFSISNGIVSALRKSTEGISEVQVSAAISPGNSGGPIFDAHGELVGAVTKYLRDGQNLNFGITTAEIKLFAKNNQVFYTPEKAAALMNTSLQKQMQTLALITVSPAMALAGAGKSLHGSKFFHDVTFDFGDQTLRTFLPNQIESCTRVQMAQPSMAFSCFGLNDTIAFTIQRFPLPKTGDLIKLSGKPVLQPKALPIVEELQQEGSWPEIEKKLTLTQRASFYSIPGAAKCQNLRANQLPHAFFSAVPACIFSVRGDTEPGSLTSDIWLERGHYLYGINIWMENASLNSFFQQVPTIAVMAATGDSGAAPLVGQRDGTSRRKLASVATERPAAFYQMNLPSDMEFVSSKRHTDGTQYDTYGSRKLFGDGSYDSTLVVDRINSVFQPVNFEKASHELIEIVTKSLNVKLKKESIEVEVATLDGLPGRLVSGFGASTASGSSGKETMFLLLIAFAPNDTYLITQISSAKDPADNFKSFKNLVGSFKRK